MAPSSGSAISSSFAAVGARATGLVGTGLVLQNTANSNVGVTVETAAMPASSDLFANWLFSGVTGNAYNVTVLTQPTYPSQTCTVSGGAGTLGSSGAVIHLTCATNPGRFVYVANRGSGNVSAFSMNTANGQLTSVAGSPFPAGDTPCAIAVDPSGRFAYVVNQGDGTVSAYAIDRASGALTTVGGSPFVTGPSPTSVAIDPSGKSLYVTNANSGTVAGYTINAASGA